MIRLLFTIAMMLLPSLMMAQASGGQIRRSKQNTITKSVSSSSSNKHNLTNLSQAEKNRILQNLIKNMVYIEGGTFNMGATEEQGIDKTRWAYPVHEVTLSSFYICKYETTQEVWVAVMGNNPSEFKGSKLPVSNVTYRDCIEFVNKLNLITGKTFRLPTEAEWEYAARGGNKSRGYKYAGSNVLSEVAWCDGPPKPHKVGLKTPNELGLFDMSGNVKEWCNDLYDQYSWEKQVNPKGASSGGHRIRRGGSMVSMEHDCLISRRDYFEEGGSGYYHNGFRLAM